MMLKVSLTGRPDRMPRVMISMASAKLAVNLRSRRLTRMARPKRGSPTPAMTARPPAAAGGPPGQQRRHRRKHRRHRRQGEEPSDAERQSGLDDGPGEAYVHPSGAEVASNSLSLPETIFRRNWASAGRSPDALGRPGMACARSRIRRRTLARAP